MPTHAQQGRLTIFAVDVTATRQRATTAHFILATLIHVASYISALSRQVYVFLRQRLPHHSRRLGQVVHLLDEFAAICADDGVTVQSITPTRVPLEGHRFSANVLTLKFMATENLINYLLQPTS